MSHELGGQDTDALKLAVRGPAAYFTQEAEGPRRIRVFPGDNRAPVGSVPRG